MPVLHAIVLGLVQGLSEFLPISSSGHLELVLFPGESGADVERLDVIVMRGRVGEQHGTVESGGKQNC